MDIIIEYVTYKILNPKQSSLILEWFNNKFKFIILPLDSWMKFHREDMQPHVISNELCIVFWILMKFPPAVIYMILCFILRNSYWCKNLWPTQYVRFNTIIATNTLEITLFPFSLPQHKSYLLYQWIPRIFIDKQKQQLLVCGKYFHHDSNKWL
jgi:hypothetical protein